MNKIKTINQPPVTVYVPPQLPIKQPKKVNKPVYANPALPALICGSQQKLDC